MRVYFRAVSCISLVCMSVLMLVPYCFFFFSHVPSYHFFLFIYFWLLWVFIAVHGLSLAVVSGGYSSLLYTGFSLWWFPLVVKHRLQGTQVSAVVHGSSVVAACGLQSVGCGVGSVVVVQGLSFSVSCGIFPDQGSNQCTLH